MRKTTLILGLGLALTVLGCGSDDTSTGTGGAGGAPDGTGGVGGVAGGTGGVGGVGGGGVDPQTAVYEIQCTTPLSANAFVLALNITVAPDGTFKADGSSTDVDLSGDIALSEDVVVGLLDSGVLAGPPFIANVNSGSIEVLIANATPTSLELILPNLPTEVNLEDDTDGNTVPGPLVIPSDVEANVVTPDADATMLEFGLGDWNLSVTATTSFGELTLDFPDPACVTLVVTGDPVAFDVE